MLINNYEISIILYVPPAMVAFYLIPMLPKKNIDNCRECCSRSDENAIQGSVVIDRDAINSYVDGISFHINHFC